MISLTDIEYAYPGAPTPVFRGLTLHLDSGSRLAVTGPDGSGKTTLAKLVTGLLKPMAGTITGGFAFPGRIAYLGGDPYDMIVGLSVEDDIVFGLENEAVPPAEMEVRLRDALHWTGLEDLRHRLTHTLSGGEQQKLALAAALAMRVQALVLDEALSMLDKPARTSIRSLIGRLRRQLGMTVIEMTNRPDDLLEADRIVVLDRGRVRFDGTSNGFVSTPWGREWCVRAGGTGGLAATLIGNGVIPGTVYDSRDLASYLVNRLHE
jgi:energy-coupling factor transport system ATP-binding protein